MSSFFPTYAIAKAGYSGEDSSYWVGIKINSLIMKGQEDSYPFSAEQIHEAILFFRPIAQSYDPSVDYSSITNLHELVTLMLCASKKNAEKYFALAQNPSIDKLTKSNYMDAYRKNLRAHLNKSAGSSHPCAFYTKRG